MSFSIGSSKLAVLANTNLIARNKQFTSSTEAEAQTIAGKHLQGPLFSKTVVGQGGSPQAGARKPIAEIVSLLTQNKFQFNSTSGTIPYSNIQSIYHFENSGHLATNADEAKLQIECQMLMIALKDAGYKNTTFTDKGIDYKK